MVRRWLIRPLVFIFVLVFVAAGIWTGVNAYTNTCGYVYDQQLSELAASDPVHDRDWEQWIRQNYGYLAWGIMYRSLEDKQIVYWDTPFKAYAVAYNDVFNYATTRPKAFRPTLDEIFQCVGTPEYYEAAYTFDGISYWYYAVLWYPQIGFIASHESYPMEPKTPEEANRLGASDQYSRFIYIKPGDIETITQQVFDYPIPNPQAHLDNMKPWRSIEDTFFEFVYRSY